MEHNNHNEYYACYRVFSVKVVIRMIFVDTLI